MFSKNHHLIYQPILLCDLKKSNTEHLLSNSSNPFLSELAFLYSPSFSLK